MRLFSYGTLQLPAVQVATYGRLLDGKPDALRGYRLEALEISDPAVVELSGLPIHHIACKSGSPADRIEGVVFKLTEAELAATDAYEVDAYQRKMETLESGIDAWLYVGPPLVRIARA